MGISDITSVDLLDDIIGSIIIDEYKEQITKRMEDGGYMKVLAGYHSSLFQDFESYFRKDIDLVEDDIRLVLDKYYSSFITYELVPGVYNFRDLSEPVFTILQPEYPAFSNVIVFEFDDINKKTKLVVGDGNIATRFDENSFFSTMLGFIPDWDYQHYSEHISHKIINLSTTNKTHLKCDVIDGSVLYGLRQAIHFGFILDKPPGYNVV